MIESAPNLENRRRNNAETAGAALQTIPLLSGERPGLQKEGIVRTAPEDFNAVGLAGMTAGARYVFGTPEDNMPVEIAGLAPLSPWNPANPHDGQLAETSTLRNAVLWIHPIDEQGNKMPAIIVRPDKYGLLTRAQ